MTAVNSATRTFQRQEEVVAKVSPTQRSLALLREQGYLAAIVEKFVRFPPPGHRVDLWGIGDILAVKPGETLLVQCTTTGVAERVRKIEGNPLTLKLLLVPWKVEVWGWRKVGPRGKAKRWEVRVERVHDQRPVCNAS